MKPFRKLPVVVISAILAIPAAAAAAPSDAAIELTGRGFQIYECAAAPAGAAWKLKGPDAMLFDAAGRVAGRHYAGPTWEAPDGSKVVGAPIVASPAPEAGAVPWLVLKAATHENPGAFAQVAFIARTDTVGGAAPPTGCDAAHLGAESRGPYSATYIFFRSAAP
jgi:hypothetical protein